MKFPLDTRARLVKATTGKELKSMAHLEPALFEAARTVAELSDDESIAEQCRVREDYYLEQLAQVRTIQRLTAKLKAAKAELAKKDEVIAEQCRVREDYYLEQLAQLRHVRRLMAELNAAKAELAFLTALESTLSGEKDERAKKDEEIAELRRQIAEAWSAQNP